MIKEDYVSFEVAKLLKDKGFDEGCRAHYGSDGSFSYEKYEVEASGCEMHNAILAPTLQMAMKWLREKYGIFIEISALNRYYCIYTIYRLLKEKVEELYNDGTYNLYEDASDKALKYCLKNLIQ